MSGAIDVALQEKGQANRRFMQLLLTLLVMSVFGWIIFLSDFVANILGILVIFVISMIGLRFTINGIIALIPWSSKLQNSNHRHPVDVIIPAFFEEGVLENTVLAVLASDYSGNLNVVLCVEERCTDQTNEIAYQLERRFENVRVILRSSPSGGKAASANDGIRTGDAPYICSIDADHVLEPDAISRAVAHLEEGADCVKGRCRTKRGKKSLIEWVSGLERDMVERMVIPSWYRIGGFAIFGGGQAFFRRSSLEEVGCFDETMLTEDVDCSIKLHLSGKVIVSDPKIISWETQPSTWKDWWNQRIRWSRGWTQSALKHVAPVAESDEISGWRKFDITMGIYSTLAVPIFIVMLPLIFKTALDASNWSFDGEPLEWWWLWISFIPSLLSVLRILIDSLEEKRLPSLTDLIGSILLYPYLLIHFLVSWFAFLDETITPADRVYIKTGRR